MTIGKYIKLLSILTEVKYKILNILAW